MTTVTTCNTQTEWDQYVLDHDGHPLQLWGWGAVKAAHNWQVDRVFIYDDERIIGAAQLLIRKLPIPFRALVYVPRGPVADDADRAGVLDAIANYVKRSYQAVAVTIEPDWEKAPAMDGWRASDNTILIPRTLILDLMTSEEELQSKMTKKTRQYIRKSAAAGLDVRKVQTRDELRLCLEIYKQTAVRAGFGLHDDQYYYDIFEQMGEHALVTAAFQNDKPVAFLWLAISQTTAFELYGGMDDDGQRLRANYILKWQTIQMTKQWGIERYDFNGLLNDGVSTFKQGFAEHETMLIGTFDKPLSPLYFVWKNALPIAKKIVRKLKNR